MRFEITMNTNGISKGYYLISKKTGIKFTQYKGNAFRIGEGIPYTVDEVLIGCTSNPKLRKKITTFRDSKGAITERVFDYSKQPLKNTLYTYEDYTIGENEYVQKTTSKTYTLKRSLIKNFIDFCNMFSRATARRMICERGLTRHNFLSSNINDLNDKKILSSILIKPKKSQEIHEFIEYPKAGETKTKLPKFLQFLVIKKSFKAKTTNSALQQDEFLAFRAYDIEDTKIPITSRFIKERNLKNANIEIDTDYIPMTLTDERLLAFYSEYDGSINFNKNYKFKSKSKLIGTARHEVEHAWQWFLFARHTGGDSPYTEKIFKIFGKLTDPKEIEEAEQYTHSIQNYVRFDENFEEYQKVLIEKLADLKGKMAREQYDNQGKTIREIFQHIPPEAL